MFCVPVGSGLAAEKLECVCNSQRQLAAWPRSSLSRTASPYTVCVRTFLFLVLLYGCTVPQASGTAGTAQAAATLAEEDEDVRKCDVL